LSLVTARVGMESDNQLIGSKNRDYRRAICGHKQRGLKHTQPVVEKVSKQKRLNRRAQKLIPKQKQRQKVEKKNKVSDLKADKLGRSMDVLNKV